MYLSQLTDRQPIYLDEKIALFTMTSLSQSEITKRMIYPFEISLENLKEREKDRIQVDKAEIFKRIYEGSMPERICTENISNKKFYSEYINRLILQDVRNLVSSIDPIIFYKFLVSIAERSGEILNISNIARKVDINENQAKKYLESLEKLGIIFFLKPYADSSMNRLSKKPKLFFFDTGLLCHLCGWSSSETLECGLKNNTILKNYVSAEIIKTYLQSGKEPPIYYYRDKYAKEIDIVLEQNGILNPIEIKKTSNPTSEDIKVFSLLDKGSAKRGNGVVLCMRPNVSVIDRDNYIVPIWTI